MKYIDAEELYEYLEQVDSLYPRHEDNIVDNAVSNVICGIKTFIATHQHEQPEMDLDALVNETFDKYSTVDGYGQIAVSFNRAELYSFIKKFARKEDEK